MRSMIGVLAAASLAAGVAAGSRADAGGANATRVTDQEAGVAVTRPKDWHLVQPPISGLVEPAERLLLTSYPAQRGGSCGPDRALRAMPPGGALVYLFEYRPRVGDPWRGLRRRDFPRRPARFALQQSALASYECIRAPSYLIRFRDADRPFQLHVVLGPRATAARRAQVLRVLDSLRFEALPPPPPDPYAGWRHVDEELGDSLRVPPGWSAGTTTSPRRYARPRSLLFASNARLDGLPPASPDRTPRRLPARIPANALPPDGVLLWVREERTGPPTTAFPRRPAAIWPRPEDFEVVERGDGRRWERTGAKLRPPSLRDLGRQRPGRDRGRPRARTQGRGDVRVLDGPLPRPAVPPRMPHRVRCYNPPCEAPRDRAARRRRIRRRRGRERLRPDREQRRPHAGGRDQDRRQADDPRVVRAVVVGLAQAVGPRPGGHAQRPVDAERRPRRRPQPPRRALPHSFVFDRPTRAQLFATDGRNEASTAEEESSGQITFSRARCGSHMDIRFRVDGVMGSEFSDATAIAIRGTFSARAAGA